MEHPDWALRHKKPGTELRLIRGHYYLYQVSSRWNSEKKRAQKVTGKLLGKITEDKGFIASSEKRSSSEFSIQALQVKEYGATHFISQHMQDSISLLKNCFPDDWQSLMAAACFRLLYQSPLKNMNFYFSHSFLSETNDNVFLNPKQVGELLRRVGNQRDKISAFFKGLISPGAHLIIDMTNIHSRSEYLSIAKSGYNSKRDFNPQINLLLIFSKTLISPVYYRILPGNIRDVKAFKLSLKESCISDAILIADKGFYSENNVLQLDESKLSYVLPLKRNNMLIDYKPLEKPAKNGLEGYFKYNNRYIWYYHYSYKKKTVFIFLDESLKNCEEQDYLNRIETQPEEYTFDKFREKNITFGTFAILTNKRATAEDIYLIYKSRNEVELVADALKNSLAADRSYMQNEAALEGWMFINFLALLWYYQIYQILKSHHLLSKFSTKDLLLNLTEVKKIRINQTWHLAEITSKTDTLLKKLGIHIT